MTEITIHGTGIYLDGKPTYAGRTFEGKRIEGLLFNVRAVQATFDDENFETRNRWAYPDTGVWDAQRNVDEFCAALPQWRDHGVLAFTVNFQGGGPLYTPHIYNHYKNNAFTEHGELKTAYTYRMQQVLEAADALGMAVIVGFFYWKHTEGWSDEIVVKAARNACQFLRDTGRKNFLIEIANENGPGYQQSLLQGDQVHKIILALKPEFPEMLFSTSLAGMDVTRNLPSPALVAACDYVLLHGNECLPHTLQLGIEHVRRNPAYRKAPKPIIINEDSPGIPNLDAAWQAEVSWGYYDQGYGGDDAYGGDKYMDYRSRPRETRYKELSGFQTPPVNWGINSPEKQAFFSRVAQVTGYVPA
ncbi:MAG TPA: hypothetical protein ENN32_07945 [Chloroflexi bacterium]|nr:hypothetical protein [Chloroflexota bacterium]